MLFLRKLHKWLGLIIGLQLVLWAASGVMFAGSILTTSPPRTACGLSSQPFSPRRS